MSELVARHTSILKRLENASILLSAVSEYRTVYEGCLAIELSLSNGDLQSAVNTIVSNRASLKTLEQQEHANDQLISLLQRATNRKFAHVQTLLSQQLHSCIRISSSSLVIDNETTLSSLIPMLLQLELLEEILNPFLLDISHFIIQLLQSPSDVIVSGNELKILPTQTTSSRYTITLQILQFLLDHFFTLNSVLIEPFQESIYEPLQSEILRQIQFSLPTTIVEITQTRESLRPVDHCIVSNSQALEIEATLQDRHFIQEDNHPIRDCLSRLEEHWCENHIESILGSCREVLLRPESEWIQYDVHEDDHGEYGFEIAEENFIAKQLSSYSKVIVSMGENE